MKSILYAIVGLAVMAGVNVNAQERAAGGSAETQMTWSTLSNQVKNTQKYAEGVNTRVDQIEACGKKGLVYAPGVAGAVNGCISAKLLDKVVNCGKQGKIYSATSDSCVVPTDLTNIITCGKEEKVYSVTTKKCESVDGGTRWYLSKAGPGTKGFPGVMSRQRIEVALKTDGYVECNSSHKMTVGRKCATQGQECAIVGYTERPCGSRDDSNCRDWSSNIYRCD